jgi:Activator of osmoprotectant transporter ProP
MNTTLSIRNHTYTCDISESGKTTFEHYGEFMKYIHDIIQELQEDFPALFPEKPQPKLPLAIGIHKELATWAQVLGVSKRNLGIALGSWTKGKRYQAALKVGKELNIRFGVGYRKNVVSVHPYNKRDKRLRKTQRATEGKQEEDK